MSDRISPATNAQPDGSVIGYMCMIDWEHEIGQAPKTTVYASLNALKQHHPMWEECGIVEVRVNFTQVICEAKFNIKNY